MDHSLRPSMIIDIPSMDDDEFPNPLLDSGQMIKSMEW